ncbi:hypothetical protein BC830DRAFT_216665 [Chytriomyces sp. MP71]|nr:hypothetical protein BC830DRAFT_216665 [Chytriomyces sp. MP71]
MALWLTSGQEDSVSYVGAILATVICALAISIHLIDDNTNVFNPPSVLAYFPNFVTQLSYIALGGVVFKACAFTSNCSESTCKAIVVGPALIIAGAIGFYLTSEIKSSLILMFGGFWRDAVLEDLSSNSDNSEDSDASVSSTHKKKRKPKAYIQRGPLDLYGLVLSWKVLQHGLKCLFFGMIASIGIVAASLGSKRPDKNWDPAYTGSVILVVSGIMSSFLFGAWLTIGTMHIFNTFVPMALLSLSMSGHVTFWGMTYGVVTFEAGMFAGSIVYGTCVLTILLATCGWSNRQKSSYIGDGWTVPMLFQVASLIGW